MANTTITQSLLDLYSKAEYHVDAAPPFILKIGETNDALKRLYENSSCNCAAFITAFNPGSKELPTEVNKARNKKLEALISSMAYQCLHGTGMCADDDGLGEASLLILGMDKDTAIDIGRQFEQNAIIWCANEAVPQLVLLR